METNSCPTILLQAAQYFANKEVTHEFAAKIIYPNGVVCPRCGGIEPSFYSNRCIYRCSQCKQQFSLKVGTIFEDSPLGLDKWLVAIWQIANCKNGIRSWELHRALGVTQKTAWFMLHRIRLAMQTGSLRELAGHVEADETYIGGKESNKHESKKLKQGRGAVGKAAVAGLLERGGGVRAKVVPNTGALVLHGNVKSNVEPGSFLFTDAHRGYSGLNEDFVHVVVDHAVE
jgi:transposase-like protein